MARAFTSRRNARVEDELILPDWIVRTADKHLPGPLARLGRTASRWYGLKRFERQVRKLYQIHRRNNAGLASDELRLRNGVVLNTCEEARETYEFFCYKDPAIVEEFDGFIRLSAGKQRLLDVGAEHGLFSFAFTQSGGRERSAIAVEPSPRGFPVLEEQVRRNSTAAVTPVNAALGETLGEIQMAVRGTHAVAAVSHYADISEERTTVRVETVDELCRRLSFEPDVVKIDVEGYELFVLRGARETLVRSAPLLFLELHPELLAEFGQSVADIVEWLARFGYEHFDPVSKQACCLPTNISKIHSLRVVFRHIDDICVAQPK